MRHARFRDNFMTCDQTFESPLDVCCLRTVSTLFLLSLVTRRALLDSLLRTSDPVMDHFDPMSPSAVNTVRTLAC